MEKKDVEQGKTYKIKAGYVWVNSKQAGEPNRRTIEIPKEGAGENEDEKKANAAIFALAKLQVHKLDHVEPPKEEKKDDPPVSKSPKDRKAAAPSGR